MKKVFLKDDLINSGSNVLIENIDYHHLSKVLRIKKNEKFIVQDRSSNEFNAKVAHIDKKKIVLEIEERFNRLKINRPEIIILFSLLKGDKNEYLIQKCTEIGVDKFIPVITQNTIVKINDRKNNKLKRFKTVAREASMQSLREKIPEISDIMLFEEIKNYDINRNKYFGYLNDNKLKLTDVIANIKNNETLSFFVGPEGDFTENEIRSLIDWNWKGINISEYILKSDTSAIFFASSIYAYFYKT
ncbi:MAG: 16S rRNA (uracil(1498)-N(3))-methyltransferase [Spirochaetes bacterium]|nr:16S rRNA (uracil(1498)-N(3))-methyltransferase [Spirochaetota bacterium]